ncbi:large subunit of alpha-aminoadipate reductase [Coemansia sp. RSA 1722]|nr:large subunit of alpha-aminoadipate reductase [Coemansia sp. RSA 1721]KAJ2606758.1 large subunit of alpha-aminoadipate reductase [Coemansia sp. RSA 1722]KAJ2639883.1 large subunit of alpha-aminoadipate reductase [Coemansia sp. RSA 1286]
MATLPIITPAASATDMAELNERIGRWQEKLRSPTELQLPTDYPRPIPLRMIEAVETFELSAQSSLSLLQLALYLQQQQQSEADDNTATPFTVLLAAFSILMHRYTAEEDIVVSSSSESSNPLVLRMAVKPTDSFLDVLRMAQRVSHDATADEVPFSALMAAIAAASPSPQQSAAGQVVDANAVPALFRVRFFNQTDASDSTLKLTTTLSTDFTVIVRQRSTASLRQLHPTIELQIAYNQVLFTSQRIAHMVAQLQVVLAAASDTLAREQAGQALGSELQVGNMSIASDLDFAAAPNPRADLNWNEYPGSITEIFARNAAKHPERRFVVESVLKDKATVERSFTYGQIFRAARALSQTLRDGGVNPEDVVVVYAYRGADLVVAILGVLMAGATYSVVDPAYPPARQNIYLSVAQPRGLVVLQRAGALPEEVKQYVAAELDVACTVPALVLQDDGTLRLDETDHVVGDDDDDKEPSVDDIVPVGHDSVGTLSFTSGSTGIPKGVRGRHYSLTHFFPWMSTEFGLGENDHFTMLSGIAHDPIQRDVFTPTFFGAELHIPTAEDIGIPGQLAQWMAEHEISVTHLTPAMGQLLSANATTPIASLRNAFFVGDLLTKRDCHRLQSLAANCRIINMYGTTETQRAVSYCAVPPLAQTPSFLSSAKDVIPAGRGMKDVQLLVVNRHGTGAMCAVGEVGEIYVRSGGLAEGYLRLPEATAEKFVPNWFAPPPPQPAEPIPFYKGPRDRMYRTGDLGRYRPDGDVECIGRIDDQVKIRGFRIELGEINNMLSQHPRIRANVTLVRRDKYEEKTLVAYIVPSEDEQRRTDDPGRRDLINAVREYLKQKLPSYAVPSVFVPMKKLPLTPNGKIDKAALPFPDTPMFIRDGDASAPTAAAAGKDAERPELESMTPTERALALVWIDLLGLPSSVPVELDANFFDIGGHSILATRMVFRVRNDFAIDAPLGLVFRCPTLRAMASAIDSLQSELQLDDEPVVEEESSSSYAADLDALIPEIPKLGAVYTAYPPALIEADGAPTFFLTGATGFLGAFVLAELLHRHPRSKVLCLTRASSAEAAMKRIRGAAEANLVWEDSWEQRVQAVVGDLGQPRLGMSDSDWTMCAEQADAIVHNGALVHWVYPYEKLRAPNVLSTIETLRMASEHHVKPLTFVSSTSALDTDYYVELGDSQKTGVRESDDLEGSRTGLGTGYGQSKWVAEKLLMHARKDGFPVTIVRPGYVLGHSQTGATNTDDFIWRLAKGCVELAESPVMNNAVNLCPVDYVARVVVESVSQPRALSHLVYHVFNRERFRFQNLFDQMRAYGYQVRDVEYMQWRTHLMEYTLANNDSALYPLLHYVLDDLPTSTKSPDLDDSHTVELLSSSGVSCPRMQDLVGLYLSYLVKAGFLATPPNAASAERQLPELNVEFRGLVSRTSHN